LHENEDDGDLDLEAGGSGEGIEDEYDALDEYEAQPVVMPALTDKARKAMIKGTSHGSLADASERFRSLSIFVNGSYRSHSKKPFIKLRRREEIARLRREFIEEMRTLSKLRHPCITTVMGAVIDTSTEPMMVMELMEYGSFYDILHNDSFDMEDDVVIAITSDVAQGLRFLHAAEPMIVHGDLKSHNVLVDNKFRAKVADFGLSQKKNLGLGIMCAERGPTGTPLWMAPELLAGSGNTSASDVYAYGILLFEGFSRLEPYEGEDVSEVLEQVVDDTRQEPKRPLVPAGCPAEVSQLMQDCWHQVLSSPL